MPAKDAASYDYWRRDTPALRCGFPALNTEAMSEFIPPFPPRPAAPLSVLAMLRTARRNFLAIFDERCFEYEFFSARVLARRVFVCNSPNTVAYALVSNNASFERKSAQMRHALAPLLGDGLFISDGATWQERRPLVASMVHLSHMPLFAPLMVEAAARLADRWSQLPPGAGINALQEMATLTAEIICRTIFGQELRRTHAQEVVDAFSFYQRHVDQIDLVSLLGLPDWIPRRRGPGLRRSAARIHRVLDEIIATIKARPRESEPSMIRTLLEARDAASGKPLGDTAVRNESAVIFMAGHETTANSLAWTWYLLSQAPESEARFHTELDRVLGGRVPTIDDVARLPFTRAVFEEALRLYPPVPLLSRQALRDEMIRRRLIKAGSLVLVVPWLLHRHKKLWDKPDHFIPERFLPENAAQRRKHSYIPFSVGPRVCAGAAFGLTEAVLCLATLGQRYALRLAPDLLSSQSAA